MVVKHRVLMDPRRSGRMIPISCVRSVRLFVSPKKDICRRFRRNLLPARRASQIEHIQVLMVKARELIYTPLQENAIPMKLNRATLRLTVIPQKMLLLFVYTSNSFLTIKFCDSL